MYISKVLLLSSLISTSLMSQISSENPFGRVLSRRKRYVVFPEGSTLSIALCMTAQLVVRSTDIFTESLNWGISYDLPNNTATLKGFKTPGGFIERRRNRRDLYQKMEVVMNSMGYNGKDCIYKALCETGALFNAKGDGLVEEILRIVFSYPTQMVLPSEPNDHEDYRQAHILGQGNSDPGICSVRYAKCTFSIIDMAMGFYAQNIPSIIG